MCLSKPLTRLISDNPLAHELEGWRGGVEDFHEAYIPSNVHTVRPVSVRGQNVALGTNASVASLLVDALTHFANVWGGRREGTNGEGGKESGQGGAENRRREKMVGP